VLVLGPRGKSLCICVLCVMLSHCLLSMFWNSYAGNFCMGLKPTFGIKTIFDFKGTPLLLRGFTRACGRPCSVGDL